MSYEKAWRSRVEALDDIRGSSEDSFRLLPRYLHALENQNPGTITRIEKDEHDRYVIKSLNCCFLMFGLLMFQWWLVGFGLLCWFPFTDALASNWTSPVLHKNHVKYIMCHHVRI